MQNARLELDDAPTIPAPASSDDEDRETVVMPRLTDRLYAGALQAASLPEEEPPDSGLECVPSAPAPLPISSAFSVALLEMRRDENRAQRALERVVARAPELSEAHYRLGMLRLKSGDANRAKTSFRLAVETLHRARELPAWAGSLRDEEE